MASIRVRNNRWRAEVFKQGVRASATFMSREDAEKWAEEYELLCGTFPPAENLALSASPRKVGAVYFLYGHDRELLYVGETSDLHRRLVRHRENRQIQFAYFAHLPCDSRSDRIKTEAHYLERYQPPHNKEGTQAGRRARTPEWRQEADAH
jgi:hypothetical protein